jgi:hypothetical protein
MLEFKALENRQERVFFTAFSWSPGDCLSIAALEGVWPDSVDNAELTVGSPCAV